MAGRSDTQYARSSDGVHIAYQILGDGPLDLLCVGYGILVSIDMRDEEPHFDRFEARLSSFCRLIRFDPRGIGLSDPVAAEQLLTTDQAVDDIVAVLDAAGSERAALYGTGSSALMAMLAAATHPERVSALVLIHSFARLAVAEDYPFGIPRELIDRFLDSVLDVGADTPHAVDDARLLAPSLAADPAYRAWWRRAGQQGASPGSARKMLTEWLQADVRAVLPRLSTPTLVLHRSSNRFLNIDHAHYLVENISGARLVELPGRDQLPYAGDGDAVVEEIEEFLTGARGESDADRPVATLLFTDIVGSTEQAARSGDREWRMLLDRHDVMVRGELRRFQGREVKTTGDGILATFGSPAQGLRCAREIQHGARGLGVEIRAGLHTGEVERRGTDVGGIAVHLAQRVSAAAGPGEVLVSRTVVDLVAGSDFEFEDRGEHDLKGIAYSWHLFRLRC